MKKIEEFPKGVVVTEVIITGERPRPVAQLFPCTIHEQETGIFWHFLPEGQYCAFGIAVDNLLAIKGIASVLNPGDVFRYMSPNLRSGTIDLIGEYLPGAEPL